MKRKKTTSLALRFKARFSGQGRTSILLSAHAMAILTFLVGIPGSHARAQGDWDIGLSAGISNYIGDIGDGKGPGRAFIWDLQELKSRPALGIFVRRKLDQSGLWHLRSDFTKIHIAGSDKNTQYAPRKGRNLHFRNRMFEVSLRLERDLFQAPLTWARQRRARVTVRGFLGVARLHHNLKHNWTQGTGCMPNSHLNSGLTPTAGMILPFSNRGRCLRNIHHDHPDSWPSLPAKKEVASPTFI